MAGDMTSHDDMTMTRNSNLEGLAVKVRIEPAATARGRVLRRARWLSGALGIVAAACAAALGAVSPASAAPAAPKLPAASYQTIVGAGSTWAQTAINTWVSDV